MSTILRVALVALAAVTAVFAPATRVWSQDTIPSSSQRRFEVASVRLNASAERPRLRVSAVPETGRLTLTSLTVREVILSAYGIQSFELVGNGSPVLAQRVDVVAKATPPTTVAEMQLMLQPLLEERFKLAVRRETREMDALLLTRADERRLGPTLKPSSQECKGVGTTTSFALNANAPQGATREPCGFQPTDRPGRIVANGIDMRALAATLAPSQGRPVLDRTGLEGRYDVDVTYTPEPFSTPALTRRGASAFPGVDPDGPTLATALRDQLGLKLESRRAPVPVVVIDRIEPLIPD